MGLLSVCHVEGHASKPQSYQSCDHIAKVSHQQNVSPFICSVVRSYFLFSTMIGFTLIRDEGKGGNERVPVLDEVLCVHVCYDLFISPPCTAFATSCQVYPSEYAYYDDSVTRTESASANCRELSSK